MYTLLILAYVYQVDKAANIAVLGGLVGLFLIPLPSILIMYGSELVFPIDESSSAGYLLAASQTFGFIMGFASISFMNKTVERSEIVFFTYCGFLLLSCLMSLWVKEDLRKMKFS